MSHIHALSANSNTYLIEPILYGVTLGTGSAYTTSISNYEIVENTIIFLKVHTNCSASATLTINDGTPIPIYYQGSPVTAGLLKADFTYLLTYHTDRWNILNNLSGSASITIDTNGGLEEGANGLKIKSNGIVNSMITDGAISNSKLEHNSITIGGHEIELGQSITLATLGLSNVLHFKGIATNNSLESGSVSDPFSFANPLPTYNGQAGDVVIYDNGTNLEEYIWIDSTNGWEQFGSGLTYKVLQTTVSDPSASGATDAFIDSISQNQNGEITVTKKYVLGWQYDRTVYTNLGNDSTSTTINGGAQNAAAIPIGIHGILGINNGGTGTDENGWQQGGIVYGVLDSSTKKYTSIAGLAHQILTSGGTGAPVWASAALLESIVNNTLNAENYTTLELGNDVAKGNTTSGHSEGRIVLYSSGIEAHLIKGAETSTGYTHILPNADGYVLQATSAAAVGSNTQPIYIAANGVATAITYVPNRLYYSYDAIEEQSYTTNFVAGDYYANGTQLGINITSWPYGNTDKLYVSGSSTITGILTITNTTDITGNTNGALVVSGGVHINKKLNVVDATTLNSTLSVTGTSTLTGRVGIGTSPDSASTGDQHILTVEGSIVITNNNLDLVHIDVDTTNTRLLFFPESNANGLIGTSANRWESLYASHLLNLADDSSSIILEVQDTVSSHTASLTITSSIPVITLNTTTSNAADWNLENNAGTFKISNSDTVVTPGASIIGNIYGFKLDGRLYINEINALTASNSLDLYVNGYTELLGNVGIGIAPNTTDFILYVNGDSDFNGHIYPHADNTYDLGTKDSTVLRWANLYLSESLDISITQSNVTTGINLDNTGVITLLSDNPSIVFDTTATGVGTSDWTFTNTAGIFTIESDSTSTNIVGSLAGFSINSLLYINEDVPSSNPYTLYVNGETYINNDVTFANNETAALYIDVSTPSFYPATTNTGTLGIGGATPYRWNSLFLGTSDDYGDSYQPIYWNNNGIPAITYPVQYTEWTISSGDKKVSFTGSGIFTDDSYVVALVVTEGEENLNGPLTWTTDTNSLVIESSALTSGAVSGYILTARGTDTGLTGTSSSS